MWYNLSDIKLTYMKNLQKHSKIMIPLAGMALVLVVVTVLALIICTPEKITIPSFDQQLITPVLGEVLIAPQPVKLSDGKYYLMYELSVVNVTKSDITLEKLVLQDPLNNYSVVSELDADQIKKILHPAKDVPTNILKANEAGVIVINLIFDAGKVPSAIDHVLSVKMNKPYSVFPAQTDERIARTRIDKTEPVVVGPPLKGKNWLAAMVSDNHGHRNAFFPVNGAWYVPERWAVDYIQLTDKNQSYTGDKNNLKNYPPYGADLIAVKNGKVLKVVDGFDDLKIGETLQNISIDNAGGNYVLLDIGGGYSAFYAHLIKGTAAVKEGDMVKRGQVLGKLGNTGNSSQPHLHFDIVKGQLALGSQGVPYVIDSFEVTGQIKTSSSPAMTGPSDDSWLPVLEAGNAVELNREFTGKHFNEMPADNSIVNFPE
jgi:hypothetical protein